MPRTYKRAVGSRGYVGYSEETLNKSSGRVLQQQNIILRPGPD